MKHSFIAPFIPATLLCLGGLSFGADISGTINYSGGQTGVVYVTVAEPRPSGSNQVLSLGGNGDYAVTTLTDLSGSANGGTGSELTVEFWFKGSSVQSAVRQQAADYIVVGWNGLAILSNDGGVGGGLSLGSTVTDGNWHHVAMTWKQATTNGFATFLDGVRVAARNSSTNPIPNMNAQVYFGAWNGNAEFMNGMIDEIAIWNRALPVAEIRSNMRTGVTGTETGLAGYWNFDDGLGKDLSPYGNGVTLIGNAQIIHVDNPGLGPVFTDELPGVGSYQIGSVPPFNGCLLSGFMDVNGNGLLDPTEPRSATGVPFNLTGDLTGANVALYDPPAILTQSSNVTVNPGGTIVLTVVAGGSAPLSYKWKKQGVDLADGGRVSGAKTAEFQIASAEIGDEAPYMVVVTNPVGSAISGPVSVLVASTNISDRLVGHWTFDETTGNVAADTSGLGNNGTVANSSGDGAQWIPGKIGGALSFRGTNMTLVGSIYGDYVAVTNFPVLTNTFSVSAWVRTDPRDGTWPETTIVENGLTNGGSPGPIGLVLRQKNRDQLFGPLGDSFTDSVGANHVDDTAGLPTGVWQHVGVVADGSRIRLYRNGAVVAVRNYSGLLVAPATTGLGIGALLDDTGVATSGYWQGLIDDVGVWNHALTTDQMAAIFLAGVAGKNLAQGEPYLTAAPAIITQPQSQSHFEGEGMSMSVQAAGPGSLSYHWKRNGTPIAGATNADYALASVQVGDAGQYTVEVTSPFGTATSDPATLTVQAVSFSTSLVGYWKFDETTGLSAADSSPYTNTAQLGNYPGDDTQWVTGQIGGALTFVAASREYVVVPQHPAATNTLTVSLGPMPIPVPPGVRLSRTGAPASRASSTSASTPAAARKTFTSSRPTARPRTLVTRSFSRWAVGST